MVDRNSVRIVRPTAHVPRTAKSVRRGPQRSARKPQPKLAITATTVRIRRTWSAWASVKPTAKTAKALITAIAVLTGSE